MLITSKLTLKSRCQMIKKTMLISSWRYATSKSDLDSSPNNFATFIQGRQHKLSTSQRLFNLTQLNVGSPPGALGLFWTWYWSLLFFLWILVLLLYLCSCSFLRDWVHPVSVHRVAVRQLGESGYEGDPITAKIKIEKLRCPEMKTVTFFPWFAFAFFMKALASSTPVRIYCTRILDIDYNICTVVVIN